MLFDCGRTAQLPCCARVVVCCYRTGWVVLVLGHWLADDFCGCLWSRASALASSAWRCWSRFVLLCSWMQCLARGTVVMLCMSSGMLRSYRLGCASAWALMACRCFLWLFLAQGECSSIFSMALLVQVCVVMLLDAELGARHSCHVVHE